MSFDLSLEISNLEQGKISPSDFVTAVFERSSAHDALEMINARTQQLDHELRSAVCANSDELLQNASDVQFLRDKVLSLKSQVTSARTETDIITSSLIDPYERVKKEAANLTKIYAICRVLRVLNKFLIQVRLAQNVQPTTKIQGSNKDIRKLCEVYKIAQSGVLNGIDVYERFWSKLKPNCENLVNLATQQFEAGIQSSNAINTTAAFAVFDYIGTAEETATAAFQSELAKVKRATALRFKSSDERAIVGVIIDDVSALAASERRIQTLSQAVSARAGRDPTGDLEPLLERVSVEKFVSEYAESLKRALEGAVRARPSLSATIVEHVPEIRRAMLRSAHGEALTDAVAEFEAGFVEQTVRSVRTALIQLITGPSVAPGAVSSLCANLGSAIGGVDRGLAALFRPEIVRLAEGYSKLRAHANSAIAGEAARHAPELAEGLAAISRRYFDEETALAVEEVLRNLPVSKSPKRS